MENHGQKPTNLGEDFIDQTYERLSNDGTDFRYTVLNNADLRNVGVFVFDDNSMILVSGLDGDTIDLTVDDIEDLYEFLNK